MRALLHLVGLKCLSGPGRQESAGARMLEFSTMLLLPWAAGQRHGSGRSVACAVSAREILDPTSTEVLGFARGHVGPARSWFSWLARPALDVYAREEEDTSLLFTLYFPWFFTRAWEVYDADEHLVGTLRGNLVLDRIGRILANVERGPDGSTLRFLTQLGYEPTSLTRAEGGFCLSFAPDLTGDPFARMMLLAAGLALTNAQQAEKR
jgi:hypothetical protein